MPPVASEPFMVAVARLVGARGMSWAELARRCARLVDQSFATWKRNLNRWKAGGGIEEENAKIIARALEVPRADLPALPRLSRKDLELRVAELEMLFADAGR